MIKSLFTGCKTRWGLLVSKSASKKLDYSSSRPLNFCRATISVHALLRAVRYRVAAC